MEVSTANDVKVYNLSSGKSLPEWISDRKKRTLLKNDLALRRRIELIQDFSMPMAATSVNVSANGQYVFAAGVYKPRVRCYDLSHLSMKFERCVDSEIINFQLLSEDYTKFVLLLANRQLEFHTQFGFYYRTRVPKFGRSLAYHSASCDLYVTAEGPEIYRLNLEEGKFLPPLKTKASACNVCEFNPQHQLFTVGTDDGTVECWDPRSHCRAGELPLVLAGLYHFEKDVVPAVTAVRYRDAMNLAVGTHSGQVLLYDLRSPRPYQVKDHLYSAPIHSISFQTSEGLVLSADSKILKIWNEKDGSTYTSVEPQHDINRVCHLRDTGMVLMAVEDPKMLAYYIPSVGVAPRWCSFLDNLTEELEEDPEPTIYQDYKFVTSKDLDELGLSHLVGTNLLRAYMHGYFMDMKFYHKARAIAQPFAYEEYRKERIRKKLEESRASRIHLKKLPKINRQLAERLLEKDSNKPGKKAAGQEAAEKPNPLGDERFAAMFTDADFEVDEESEEFQRLHPVLSHRDKKREEKRREAAVTVEEEEELEGKPSDAESSSDESDPEIWQQVRREARERHWQQETTHSATPTSSAPVTIATSSSSTGLTTKAFKAPSSKASLGHRLKRMRGEREEEQGTTSLGSKERTFTLHKVDHLAEERQRQRREHGRERREVRRSANSLLPKKKQAVYWRGRRVK